MSDETNHELLSAYLDGELSADQRQRVERLISESAECRQVYEELCALRASLSSLPRHKVGEDLGPRVLRMAEEARLAAQERDQAEIVPAGAQPPTRRASPSWRAIIYPVVAVAAAIAMLVTQSKDNRRSDKEVAYTQAKPAFDRTKADPPASMSAAPEKAGEETVPLFAKDQGSKTLDADDSATESEDVAADKKADRMESRVQKDKPLAKSVKPLEAGSGYFETNRSTKHFGTVDDTELDLSRKQQAATWQNIRLPAKATLVLDCKLAPLAARDKAFETLLARNHLIPISGPPGAEKLALEPSDDRQNAAGADSANSPSAAKLEKLDEKVAKSKVSDSLDRYDRWSKTVIVEMDARQLVAVLNDLQNHPEQFLAINLATNPTDKAEKSESDSGNSIGAEPADDELTPTADELVADDMPSESAPADADAPQAAAPAPAHPAAAPAASQAGATRPATPGGMMGGMGPVASAGRPERVRVLFRLSAMPEK